MTASFIANCLVATSALGQVSPAGPPADCSAYVSVPLPIEAEVTPVPKAYPACASYRSYRGIGRFVNYSEARTCAWQERLAQKASLAQNQKEPTAWVVGGSLILADIYFNGAGVKRNVPLAMRLACESEEGMAKLALEEIAKLGDSPRAHKNFEFCDYAVTTFTLNFCSGYASEIQGDRRSLYYSSLESSMTPEQRAAFKRLLTAQNAFIEAHASEVYQGGSIRVIRTLGSQEILNNLFHTDITHFERQKWPVLSVHQITTADSLLLREYKKALEHSQIRTKGSIDQEAVTDEGLSSAEDAWEAYRDGWVAFARLRYPAAAAAIRAKITLDRYRFLKTIS